MPSIPIYIMLAVVVAPALIKAVSVPVAAHLFIYYWGHITFITPPLAMAVFVSAGIAGAKVWQTGWTATRLGIIAFIIPAFAVLSPALILIGPIGKIVLEVVTAMLGVFPLSYGQIGFAFKPLSWWERILLIVGGVALLTPSWVADVVGVVLTAPILLWQVRTMQMLKNVTSTQPGRDYRSTHL